MATDNVVNELIINKLTQAQFDAIPEAERSDTELYFITDAEIGGGKGAQVEEMPEATESNLRQIVQYVGETIQDTDTSTITQVVGNSLTNLKVDSKKFAEKLGITAAETVEFTHNINRGFNNTSDYIYPGGNAVSVAITNPTLLLTTVEQLLEHYPEHSINSLVKILFDIAYSEEKSQNIVINIGTAFSDNPDAFYPITGHIDYDLDEEHIGVVVGNEYPANEVWSVVFDVLNQVFWKNDNIDVVLPSDGTIQFTTTKGNITFECDYQSFINYLTNTSIIPYNWKNEDIPEYLLKSSFTYNAGNNCWVYPPLAAIDDSWVRNFMQVSGDVQDGDSVEYVLTLPNEGNVITNINQYGITYSGTPSTDDKIKVDYYPPVSGYEKGYFYTNKEQLTSPEVIITQTTGTSLSNLKIDRDTFIKVENPTSDLTTIFEVVSGGTRYEIEEKVGDYELSIDVSKVVAFAIDKLHPELKQGFLNGEQLRITIQDYRNQPDNSAYPWGVDIWTPSTGTINVGNRMATYWVTDIFGVDFDAESINDIGTLVFSCYYSEPAWIKNNDSQVTLRDYGISFNKGIPASGDVITVDYKLPTSYGMSWEQINVQPASNAIQVTEMPEASEENAGKILQYIGTPTSEYDQGYFYKSVVVSQTESSISASIKEGEPYADELSVSIDSEKFIAVIDKEFGSSSGLYRVASSVSADRVILAKLTADGKTEKSVMFYCEPTLENLYGEVGITLTLAESGSAPDLSNYTAVRIDIVYSESQTICEWRQINVQPSSGGGGEAPSELPNLTGNEGRFLSNNGSELEWVTPTTSNMNIPAHPTTPGAYTLMCYVDENGSASYAWENVA